MTSTGERRPSLRALLSRREPERTAAVTVTSPFAHPGEALAALGRIPLLKALAAGQFLAALSAGATSALLVVLAQDRLGGGEGYGLLVPRSALVPPSGPCCSCAGSTRAARCSSSGPTRCVGWSTWC